MSAGLEFHRQVKRDFHPVRVKAIGLDHVFIAG